MTWGHPERLVLLVGVLLLAGVAWWATRAHHARLAAAFPHGFDRRILPDPVRRRRRLAVLAALGSLASLVVALAEPRGMPTELELEAEGVDLVLAVDLSRSMDARDVDPSRLERARREILDLSERLQGDRVGLVIYAGGAYPRMPLTLDYSALEMLVRELDTHVFQAQGSNLAEAIREGTGLLDQADGTAGKAIVVLSDGEVHRPEDAFLAADEAAAAGVVVYGWIIGTETAPIPNTSSDGRGDFVVDPRTGETATSTPDPSTLEEVARRTGGAVVQSVAGTADVEALYDREIRQTLRASVGRTATRRIPETRVGWPLALAVGLGLIAAWLGDGRRRAVVPAMAGLLAGLLTAGPAHAADPEVLEQADAAYRAGRSEQAVQLYESLVAEAPDDPDLLQRLGAARYRTGDARGAAEAFDRARTSGDPDASFNAGNAWWQSGLLDRARQRYEEALRRDPTHAPAQENLRLVQQAIEQRQAAQPPPQGQADEPPPEGDDQDGEDSPQPGDGTPEERPGEQGGEAEEPGESSEGQQPGSPDGEAGPESGEQQGAQQGEQPADPNQPDAPPSGQSQGGQASDEPPPEGDGTREEQGGRGEDPEDLEDLQEEAEGGGASGGEAGEPGADSQTGGDGGDAAATEGAGEDASRRQAERILDGVEEGRPRVFVPGRGGELPW